MNDRHTEIRYINWEKSRSQQVRPSGDEGLAVLTPVQAVACRL